MEKFPVFPILLLRQSQHQLDNPHVPTKIKHSVYDMEMRRFDEINRNPNAFKKMNDGIDGFLYINKKRKNDERY